MRYKPDTIIIVEQIIENEIKQVNESDLLETNPSFCMDDNEIITGLNLTNYKKPKLESWVRSSGLAGVDLPIKVLSNLKPISKLTGLKTLHLSGNQISDLTPLSSLTQLTQLGLSDNKIIDCTSLSSLSQLTFLYLGRNQIKDLSPLTSLKRLLKLSVRSNDISDISCLTLLTGLKYLDLCHNQLKNLLPQFLKLNIPIKWEHNYSDGIYLEGNPLKTPPIEIIRQGHEAVVSYFNQLKESKVRLLQCKLLIVGSGEVGKTSLMKKLKDPSSTLIEKEPTTHGINIIPWELQCKLKSCTETDTVKALFWDFGGQDIYHATHQFFLTKRSVYILVWEARKEEESNSFNYWLNVIKLLGSNSPIIVVMNKSDIRIKPIDEEAIQKKFPNIKGFLHVSCLNNTGLTQLTERITKTLEDMPHLQDLLPTSWLHIRDELKTLDQNYITADAFFDICEKHDINHTDAIVIADYLHDLGTILYFRHDPLLRDMVILKPEWATTAVYKLLDTNQIILDNGSFDFDDLKQYWDRVLYPESKHPQIIRLMEKFELCFNFNPTQKYFIPELLPGKGIPFDTSIYQTGNVLRFQYRYEFMPEGILSRFISRLYYLIRENRFRKFAVELEFDHSSALITSDPLNSLIQIQVAGSNKPELFAIIRSHFNHIHQTLNMTAGTHFNEMIPCNCPTCRDTNQTVEPFYYSYSQLIKFRDNKIYSIPCNSCNMVNVEDLLNGFAPRERDKEMLESLLDASKKLMGNSRIMKPEEDARTGLICLLMNKDGFIVRDQKRWGQSETGINQGELDAMIQSEDGNEAIMEAFILKGFNANTIESHCLKIFKYDPVGFKTNFILVYCDCTDEKFIPLWNEYKEYVKKLPFPHNLKLLEDYPSPYPEIKIARAIHNRHEEEVGIYHLFLHTS